MRDAQELHDVSKNQKFPKNNFFCYRWRVIDNFSRLIDRQMFQLQAQGKGNNISLLSDRILQGYKARQHDSNKDLIVDLAQDTMSFLNRRRDEHRMNSKVEVLLSKATASLMNRTFNTLLAFSAELNTMLGMSELFITSSEPEITKRSNQSPTSPATCIQSNIATKFFRLVLEGKQDKISFYMIPADSLGALNDLTRYIPISVWQAQFAAQDQIYWVSSNGILTEDLLDFSCSELIRNLIETTQEAISPKDAFKKVDLKKFNLGENDPWQQEKPIHTISSEGTRTDSVPSLAALFEDSGVFNTSGAEFYTPAAQAEFSTFSNESEPIELLSESSESAWQPVLVPSFDGTELPSNGSTSETNISESSVPAWQPVLGSAFDAPNLGAQVNSLPSGVISFDQNQESGKKLMPPPFDLKMEYFADKPKPGSKATKSTKTTRADRKAKKNRKKKN